MTMISRRGCWACLPAILGAGLALALLGGPAAAIPAAASAKKTVSVKSFAFQPATLKVPRGTRVAFANRSAVAHTATAGSFDTERIPPQQSVAVRFNRSGSFAYHCKIHPSMKGKIVVE
jgi:plastocyanin